MLQFISQHLEDNIIKANGTVLGYFCWVFNLWNEDNMSPIKIWGNNAQVKKI